MTRDIYDDKMTLIEENWHKLHALMEVFDVAQEGHSVLDSEHISWYTETAIDLLKGMEPVIKELHEMIHEWPGAAAV